MYNGEVFRSLFFYELPVVSAFRTAVVARSLSISPLLSSLSLSLSLYHPSDAPLLQRAIMSLRILEFVFSQP